MKKFKIQDQIEFESHKRILDSSAGCAVEVMVTARPNRKLAVDGFIESNGSSAGGSLFNCCSVAKAEAIERFAWMNASLLNDLWFTEGFGFGGSYDALVNTVGLMTRGRHYGSNGLGNIMLKASEVFPVLGEKETLYGSNSNGCAVFTNEREALLRGAMEIIERSIWLDWWRGNSTLKGKWMPIAEASDMLRPKNIVLHPEDKVKVFITRVSMPLTLDVQHSEAAWTCMIYRLRSKPPYLSTTISCRSSCKSAVHAAASEYLRLVDFQEKMILASYEETKRDSYNYHMWRSAVDIKIAGQFSDNLSLLANDVNCNWSLDYTLREVVSVPLDVSAISQGLYLTRAYINGAADFSPIGVREILGLSTGAEIDDLFPFP